MCDAIVGNSSSGIIEAPSLLTATINIGDRQKGRTQAESILNCSVNKIEILNCFKKVKEKTFRESILAAVNPYGNGGTSEKIMNILATIDFNKLHTKEFYNIKYISNEYC